MKKNIIKPAMPELPFSASLSSIASYDLLCYVIWCKKCSVICTT